MEETQSRGRTSKTRGGSRQLVKSALSPGVGDVVEVNDRTTHVNLAFLEPSSDRRRITGIVEPIIKIHSPIPEPLQVTSSGKKGTLVYHITNDYLSPVRAQSPVRRSMPPPANIPKPGTLRPKVTKVPELVNGIVLSPTRPGLRKCVLKYGSMGLTPELVGQVQTEYPEKSRLVSSAR